MIGKTTLIPGRTRFHILILSILFNTSAAAQSIYWLESAGGTVQYADRAGGGSVQGIAEGLNGAFAVADNADTIYWSEPVAGIIRRVPGIGNPPEIVVSKTTVQSPRGIAVDQDGGKLYWSDNGTKMIYRANLDGTGIENLVTTGLVSPGHVAVDHVNEKLYWMDNGLGAKKISRSNLDGTLVEDVVMGIDQGWGIALNIHDSLIYWIDSGDDVIRRASLAGTLPDTGSNLITPLVNNLRGLVSDVPMEYLYWADITDGSIQRASINGSSIIALYTDLSGPQGLALDWNSALPVQITSFTASANRSNAELRWRTESEVENHGFEIERREMEDGRWKMEDGGQKSEVGGQRSEANNSQFTIHDSQPWQVVGFVPGAGTSSSPRDYSFVDKPNQPGRYAYRIKQIDHSGAFTYTSSLEVIVGLAPLEFSLSQNYPNPFNPSTTIEFTLPVDGRVVLKVFNLVGEEVMTLLDEERTAGQLHQAVFDAGRLSSGSYLVQLQFEGNMLLQKVVLLK